LNSNGTFAIGNSTANISFNGSTFTFNGEVVSNTNLKANSTSAIYSGAGSVTSSSWSAGVSQYSGSLVACVPPTGGRGNSGKIVLSAVVSVGSNSATNRGIKVGFQISTDGGSTWSDMDTAWGGATFSYYMNAATFTTTDFLPLAFADTLGGNPLYPITSTTTYRIRCKVSFNASNTTSHTFKFNLIAMDLYK
jgi:hypothetical protein